MGKYRAGCQPEIAPLVGYLSGQALVLGASSQLEHGSRQTIHSRVTAPHAQYS
jgi:hypothetical protein